MDSGDFVLKLLFKSIFNRFQSGTTQTIYLYRVLSFADVNRGFYSRKLSLPSDLY